MIESYAYEIIKQEGIEEGIERGALRRARESIYEVLDVRFDFLPLTIMESIEKMQSIYILKSLLRKAVTVNDLDEFKQIVKRLERDIVNGSSADHVVDDMTRAK